jgi:ERF superfamily
MYSLEQVTALKGEELMNYMKWRASFHAKKSKATADMKRVPKNGYNSFHKYHYAQESDVKDLVREILLDNGLSYTVDLIESKVGVVKNNNKDNYLTTATLLFILTDIETGYFETYEHEGTAMDTSDKGIYKAYSNTIKYFLMDQFLIPTGDDVERPSEADTFKGSPPRTETPPQESKQQSNTNTPQQQTTPSQGNNTPWWKRCLNARDKLAEFLGVEKGEVLQLLKAHLKVDKLNQFKNMSDAEAEQCYNAMIEMYNEEKKKQEGE